VTRRFVIDTDTGSDDAVALMLAAFDDSVEIVAVTTVAGNVGVAQATTNALYTLEFVGCSAPVYVGRGAPLLQEPCTAQEVHGVDGMGDIGLPAPKGQPQPEFASDVLRSLALENPGNLTLVTLGPLTNVAAALATEPDLLARYAHTYIMGGAIDAVGNASACAEYNFWADPEAAQMVLAAPGAKTMVGWDVARKYAVIKPKDQKRLTNLDTVYARFVHEINGALRDYALSESGLSGYDLPDPITMAIAIDPDIVARSEELAVNVSTSSQTRGLSFADRRRTASSNTCTVVCEANEARFKESLFTMCSH